MHCSKRVANGVRDGVTCCMQVVLAHARDCGKDGAGDGLGQAARWDGTSNVLYNSANGGLDGSEVRSAGGVVGGILVAKADGCSLGEVQRNDVELREDALNVQGTGDVVANTACSDRLRDKA